MNTTETDAPIPGDVLINRKVLLSKVPLSARTIDTLEKAEDFPRRIVLSRHSVAWSLSEVDAWMAQRRNSGAKARRPGATPGEKSSHPACRPSLAS